MKLKLTLAAAALLTMALSSAAAYADTVNFTLTNSTEFVDVAGGTATFDATVSAPSTNGAPVFLNGDSYNATAPITLDDSDFFNTFPLSLVPGTSFTGALFTITVPPNSPFGTFLGTFTLLGGPNNGSTATLGAVNFSVTTTPEPSSVLLLLTGLGGLAIALRRTGSRESLRVLGS